MAWKSSFRQNYRTTFSPTVPTSAAGISHVVADVEAPGGEKWEHLKKSGGKQWQATPKNFPRMQRTRAIPVAWLSSGLCPDRQKGWIPVIIIISNALYKEHRLSWIRIFKFSEYWRGSNLGSVGFRRSEVKKDSVLTHCRCKGLYIQRSRPSYCEPKSRKFVVLN